MHEAYSGKGSIVGQCILRLSVIVSSLVVWKYMVHATQRKSSNVQRILRMLFIRVRKLTEIDHQYGKYEYGTIVRNKSFVKLIQTLKAPHTIANKCQTLMN